MALALPLVESCLTLLQSWLLHVLAKALLDALVGPTPVQVQINMTVVVPAVTRVSPVELIADNNANSGNNDSDTGGGGGGGGGGGTPLFEIPLNPALDIALTGSPAQVSGPGKFHS
jgi:uncharacterized membrane protein YgcG